MTTTGNRFVSGDTFRGLCDQIFWSNARPEENPTFRHGDLVFCKIDEAWRLLRAARRQRSRIVLVTGEGDLPVSPRLWAHKPPQVAEWFGTNHFVSDPCAHAIPLGIGNAGDPKALSAEDLADLPASTSGRKGLLYANFSSHSNPAVREPLLEWLQAPEQAWVTREAHGSTGGKQAYLARLLSHQFVLCPPGNGEDTHRMWEALYAGAIPVIRRSPAMEAFTGLPLLVVDDLREISQELLRNAFAQTAAKSRSMLEVEHWRGLLTAARERTLRLPRVNLMEWLLAWAKELAVVAGKRSR
ncbi:MAG: hypothetical protein Fur0032_01830 [Terrimicrobiaceae bacterium]